MNADDQDDSTRGSIDAGDETVLESIRTRKVMTRIAFLKSLDEFLDQELTSIVDISEAVTLTELPARGAFGSIRNFLSDVRPSLQILTMLKSASKQRSKNFTDGELNPPTVIYLAAICAARLRLNAKITEFDDGSLIERIDRLLDDCEFTSPISDLFVDTRFKLATEMPGA